jgi:hypothetical protein
MSKTCKHKPSRPTATLIREEIPDNQLKMLAIQVDHRRHLVEAIAGVLICLAHAIKEEEEKHPEAGKMPPWVHSAFARLDEAIRGER